MSETVGLFAMSVVLLAAGAEGFARGLSRLKLPERFRFLAVGLTFSAPVVIVCIVAGYGGYPRTAVAIVVGSGIANVGLLLALATLAQPLAGSSSVLRIAISLLVAATLLALFLVRDNRLEQWEGGVLLAAAIGAGVLLVKGANDARPSESGSTGASWIGVVLALTGVGWMIGAAVLFMRSSMENPEVVNRVGIGGSAFLFAVSIPALALRGIAASIAVRVNDLRTRRWEAALHLAAYAGFVLWLLPKF